MFSGVDVALQVVQDPVVPPVIINGVQVVDQRVDLDDHRLKVWRPVQRRREHTLHADVIERVPRQVHVLDGDPLRVDPAVHVRRTYRQHLRLRPDRPGPHAHVVLPRALGQGGQRHVHRHGHSK